MVGRTRDLLLARRSASDDDEAAASRALELGVPSSASTKMPPLISASRCAHGVRIEHRLGEIGEGCSDRRRWVERGGSPVVSSLPRRFV